MQKRNDRLERKSCIMYSNRVSNDFMTINTPYNIT